MFLPSCMSICWAPPHSPGCSSFQPPPSALRTHSKNSLHLPWGFVLERQCGAPGLVMSSVRACVCKGSGWLLTTVGVGGLYQVVAKAGQPLNGGHCWAGPALFGFADQRFACRWMQITADARTLWRTLATAHFCLHSYAHHINQSINQWIGHSTYQFFVSKGLNHIHKCLKVVCTIQSWFFLNKLEGTMVFKC